jgi:DNA-binding IclR family transcriptional regulator
MLSSVGNALRVMEFVAHEGEAGVSQIADALGLTVGTAHRLVSTLVQAGYVEQNPTNRRYRPGPKISELARMARPDHDFVALAHPRLRRLMAETGETTNLGVLRDGLVVYIDRAVTSQPLAVTVSIGSRVPAYCTSLGRAILAFSDPDVRADYVKRLPQLARHDPQVAPSRNELKAILATTQEHGYAEDAGDFSPDIACLGGPVLDEHGHAVAAVSIAGPRSRITDRKSELLPLVQNAAKELSDLLQTLGSARI